MAGRPSGCTWLASGALVLTATAAVGATRTIDFDSLPLGTVVTNQYDGVEFSAAPQSCGGKPVVNLVILAPNGGTSSGSKGLGITTGCPDFSPDYIRMVFAQPQDDVTFTLGDSPGTYQVRAYNQAGALLSTQSVTLGGSGFVGVYRAVRVSRVAAEIRRIEIDSTIDNFEVIDDLTFACPDATPPVVEFSSPAYEACVCGTSVTVRGRACDEEGYDRDTLEYLAVNAAVGTGWTLIGSATTPQCTPNGLLYVWNVAAVPDGGYYVRLTSYNACGLVSSAITVVWVDHNVDTPVVRSPADGSVLGGTVCVDGTVWDGANANCLESYTVTYRPSGEDDWTPVDAAHPLYPDEVVNDPIAHWATAGLPDGKYQLRASATNTCGASSADVIRTVIIDNTPPTALITDPLGCQVLEGDVIVRGTASDTHLDNWTLQYTGGDAHGWVNIAQGTGAVNGILGTWDTTGLRQCAYTLRLVVTDKAIRDCNGAIRNRAEYLTSLYVGEFGLFDYDGDGDVDLVDFAVFQRCESGPAIPALPECLSR